MILVIERAKWPIRETSPSWYSKTTEAALPGIQPITKKRISYKFLC